MLTRDGFTSAHLDLELYNEAAQLVYLYHIYRCWVSEYQAIPDLDSNCPAIAIQLIVLQNEGWERDTSVTEPKEPSFNVPGTAPAEET